MINKIRISTYCLLIFICSVLTLPEDYKIDKRNVLNQWFVKLGWFWTSSLVAPFSLISLHTNDKDSVSSAILRVVFSTFIWFTSVNLFQFVDDQTGFDISGHTFLLIFSNLLITSELKLHNLSEQQHNRIKTDKKSPQTRDTDSRVRIFKTALITLTILWDFMLLQTALFYHTIIQKLIAAAWAIGSWYIVHQLFYDRPRNSLKVHRS